MPFTFPAIQKMLEGQYQQGNIDQNALKSILGKLHIDKLPNVGNQRFGDLPSFDLPPAPSFDQGFTPPHKPFTDFGGAEGLDTEIMNLLKNKALRDRITGVVPDRADYEKVEAAKWAEIMSAMGLNQEQLAANLSARGMGGAGEIPRYLVRDIKAPAARAMATVSAEAGLAFSRDVTAAKISEEQLLAGSRGQWLEAGKVNAQLASTEAMFGADMESRERMEANRNALTKGMHDDNISLDVYKTQLNAQLSEYLSKMNWLTETDKANIIGEWNALAAKEKSKGGMWGAFGTFLATWAGAGFPMPSDERLKEDIQLAEPGLAEISKLSPSVFTWKTFGTKDMGLIAQEVQKVIPEAVDKLPDGEHLGIKPMALIAVLVNSVKELKAEVNELKAAQRG